MLEKINYYKRHLYQSGKYRDVYPLARIDHPLAVEILLEAAQSDAISKQTRVYVHDALLIQDDPRGHALVVQAFQTDYQHNFDLLTKIHKLRSRQLIPTLKNTLENLDNVPRLRHESIVKETMRCLAIIAPEEAIPLLENILECHPFDTEDILLPSPRYGLAALSTLKEIDMPSAQAISEKWDRSLKAHIQFHIEKGTILHSRKRRSLDIPQEIGTRPEIIQYMLKKLDRVPANRQIGIVSFLAGRLNHLEDQPAIRKQVLDTFYEIAANSENIRLRRIVHDQLTTHGDERQLGLALAALEDPELRLSAVQALYKLEYTGAVDEVIDIIENERLFSSDYRHYLRYLGMSGSEKAEAKLASMINSKNYNRHIPFVFNALAMIARHSDTAFEILCQALGHRNNFVQKNAIVALGKVGERSIGILITLLEGNKLQTVEAIKALNSSQFQAALPYITPCLLHDQAQIRKLAYKTIKTFQSEAAFAALNAYEKDSASH